MHNYQVGQLTNFAGTTEFAQFMERFTAKWARKPRVLHLGNVANNAYHNAKLMRAAGVDCDVVSPDYYHIMGCPEWEDADFAEAPPDHFYPDWTKVRLSGYARPGWFVQGPEELCIRYLAAKIDGKEYLADLLWRALALANRTRRPSTSLEFVVLWLIAIRDRLLSLARVVVTHPQPRRAIRRKLGRFEQRVGKTFANVACTAILVLTQAMRAGDAILRRLTGRAKQYELVARDIIRLYGTQFPEREDRITAGDLEGLHRRAARWQTLFAKYDIIHAYGIDPILPFLCRRPYVAFEHGTLRDIPFERSTQGRLTALAYRMATHVFVTNYDCLPNATYLSGNRVSFVNHPFDENVVLNLEGSHSERLHYQERLNASFLFFYPTRHDWTRPGADKANDVFLRAFARLRGAGHAVGLICCEWGGDVEASKQLLTAHGCSAAVHWISPVGIVRFGRIARACDLVVDQFRIGAFGGVLFKAFAFGAPVMTYINEAAIKGVFGVMPPIVNCRTEDEIVSASIELLSNPAALIRLSRDSCAWLRAHHRGADTASVQLEQYARLALSIKEMSPELKSL